MEKKTILITGSSGFIGFHLAQALLAEGHAVIGIDNENDYYDPTLKQARREYLAQSPAFQFIKGDLVDRTLVDEVFEKMKPQLVFHLAAQAGVRYSFENPYAYIDSNIVWFHNVLIAAASHKVEKFFYASSASIYWSNEKRPFAVGDMTDAPISLYGATKKANELIAHAITHMYGMPTMGLRFFNVYGPRWRPDGAFFIFTQGILEQTPITVYNHGKSLRNFTYIDDVIDAMMQLKNINFTHHVVNIGNTKSVLLDDMISALEKACGMPAIKEYAPLQPTDIAESEVDISHTQALIDWTPRVHVHEGVVALVDRRREYYKK